MITIVIRCIAQRFLLSDLSGDLIRPQPVCSCIDVNQRFNTRNIQLLQFFHHREDIV